MGLRSISDPHSERSRTAGDMREGLTMTDKESRETTEEGLPDGKVVSRREFLKYAGIAGAAVAVSGGLGGLIAACGGETTETTGATTATTTATTTGGTTATTGATTTVSAGPTPPSQDKIVIGAARPISGANAVFEAAHFGPAYKLWAQDVNAAGGLNVAGKKLPIELLIYDDQSNMDTSMRLMAKLMEEDKVDFIFPPCSTAFLFAGAGVASAHNYILISGEGGATSLEAEMAKGSLPYYFQILNYSNHAQMPAFAEICKELGMKTSSVVYLDDLHGIEYQAQWSIFASEAGIKVLSNTAIPAGVKDVSSILKKIQGENPDVVLSFQYPPENILTISTLIQMAYDPKAFLCGPGGSTQSIYDIWQGAADGMFFEGAWTPKMNADVDAYYKKLSDFVEGKANVDFWGSLQYRAELEFFQQAIEQAATLDQPKIAEVMRTAHFKTTMTDDFFFTNQILDVSCYSGQIGQWQNGFPQVVDVGSKRTAAPVFPKPKWADAAASGTSSTT
jgi:branched-chain amino acid transport system substrate-binding protein